MWRWRSEKDKTGHKDTRKQTGRANCYRLKYIYTMFHSGSKSKDGKITKKLSINGCLVALKILLTARFTESIAQSMNMSCCRPKKCQIDLAIRNFGKLFLFNHTTKKTVSKIICTYWFNLLHCFTYLLFAHKLNQHSISIIPVQSGIH